MSHPFAAMHRLLPIGSPAGSWPPRLNAAFVRAIAPLRRLIQRRQFRIQSVAVEGLEHLREILTAGDGAMLISNHVSYPDPFLLAEASAQVRRPFYYMTAWQVFGTSPRIKRLALQRLGCFSVDREGSDLTAFRTAVDILQRRPHPLVVFPEGEMYHVSEQLMPFHDGAAAIVLAAARKAARRVYWLPCALRYESLESNPRATERLLERLEERFFWRPRSDLDPVERVYRLADGALSLKEIEHLGHPQPGTVSARLQTLCETLLVRLERTYHLAAETMDVPERVKRLRRAILAADRSDDAGNKLRRQHLDEVFLAVQTFSYPGDYLRESPTPRRLADTLDKLEEDILQVVHAQPRETVQARLRMGAGQLVPKGRKDQPASQELTGQMESRVQEMMLAMRCST